MPDDTVPPDLRFFAEEKKAKPDDVKGAPVTIAFEDPREGKTIRAFRSEQSFRAFIGQHVAKERLDAADDLVRKARELKDKDHSRAKKLQQSRQRWIEQELKELERDTGLKPPELYRRAKDPPPTEGALLHTAFCHEHWDGTGGVVFLLSGIPVPDFGWFGMSNKTSSLAFWGFGTLWDGAWFSGPTFWYFGVHLWWPPMQLRLAGWDDRASCGVNYVG